jgi:hypothetical protein
MLHRSSTAAVAIALAAAFGMTAGSVAAADDANYPDWSGAWARFVVPGLGGQPSFDQTKPWGLGQQAPLTLEYQKVLEASLADQAQGGQGNFTGHAMCLPAGMPLMMIAFRPLELVVTPDTTYVLIGGSDHFRRIFTDGREWPAELEPTLLGYSIGHWIDTKGDGHFNELDVETRGFRGPRAFDASGLPLHEDSQTVVKERIFLDQADPNVAHDEVTVYDHALTRPWTVTKNYRRSPEKQPSWTEEYCEDNNHVSIGKDDYMLSADGLLMPAKKDQPPPDLRYFRKTAK